MNALPPMAPAEVLAAAEPCDLGHMVEMLELLRGTGWVIEVRVLMGKRTDSGYFDDLQKLAKAVEPYAKDPEVKGVYFTINPVDPSLLSRAANRIERYAKATTTDEHITGRKLLTIDIDPKRASGISSSQEEFEAAYTMALQVRNWMTEQGCPEPAIVQSGNGIHLHYGIDEPNSPESTELIKNTLAVVDEKFSNDKVDIDTSVHNASRIMRLPGTTARKGDNTQERPHRQCRKLSGPQTLQPVPTDVLQAIAARKTPQEPQRHATRPQPAGRQQYHDRGRLNIPLFLERRGIRYRKVTDKYGDKYQIDCPFDDSHKMPDAFLRQMEGGQINYSCSHDSCQPNKWREFRAAVGDPNDDEWENPPPQNPSVFETPVGGSPLNPGENSPTADNIGTEKKIHRDPSTPFPIEALPERLRNMAESVASAVGVDSSFPVLPMLTAASTAIGNSRYVQTKAGSVQPLMLWTAVIGSSGTQKSEPFSHAERPIDELHEDVLRENAAAMEAHKEDEARHKLAMTEWKKSGGEGAMPKEPPKPPRGRLKLTDFTYEALVESHAGSPRGVQISCEELSAWFGSFDRYTGKGAASSEQARYLQAYDGKSLTSDRVSGFRYVPKSFINISGTIQPGIMAKCLTSESRQNGLASRIWMAYPEAPPISWNDEEVCSRAALDYRNFLRDLWSLKPQATSDDGWPVPVVMEFSRDARSLFAEFMNRLGDEASSAGNDDIRAALVKWIGRCARLAGILQCCDAVDGNTIEHFEVQPETVERAIEIASWGVHETYRIYTQLSEPEEVQYLRRVAQWMQRKGGRFTARELAKARRDVSTSEDGDAILRKMVSAGMGGWEGTHSSRRFVLDF